MKLSLILLISFVFLFSTQAWSAACCGGGSATPSLISGDEKAQWTTSISAMEVVVESVDSQGIWHQGKESQQIRSLRMEGAHIFADLWQVGFSGHALQRSYVDQTYSGLGDVKSTLGYEYLPDWDYNPYRPKGIGYLQLTLPTGKSRAESELGGLDSRGNGFWALGAGTLLTKSWASWDVFSTLELHRSAEKKIENSFVRGTARPGFGGIFGFGIGYSLKDYRLGSSLVWNYEDPVNIETDQGFIKGFEEKSTTASFSLSYSASEDWTGTAIYSDQTLFGSPLNTSLGRSLALQIQKRWAR